MEKLTLLATLAIATALTLIACRDSPTERDSSDGGAGQGWEVGHAGEGGNVDGGASGSGGQTSAGGEGGQTNVGGNGGQTDTGENGGGDPSATCQPFVQNNEADVGAYCVSVKAGMACPVTLLCSEDFGKVIHTGTGTPYYCTKACTDHEDCGTGARCCAPNENFGKRCVLNSCPDSCPL